MSEFYQRKQIEGFMDSPSEREEELCGFEEHRRKDERGKKENSWEEEREN